MTARALLALLTLAALAACAAEAPAPVVMEEPVAEAPEADPAARAPDAAACVPGDGDGIGGTGCPVD